VHLKHSLVFEMVLVGSHVMRRCSHSFASSEVDRACVAICALLLGKCFRKVVFTVMNDLKYSFLTIDNLLIW